MSLCTEGTVAGVFFAGLFGGFLVMGGLWWWCNRRDRQKGGLFNSMTSDSDSSAMQLGGVGKGSSESKGASSEPGLTNLTSGGGLASDPSPIAVSGGVSAAESDAATAV